MYLGGGPRRARLLFGVAMLACGLALARPQPAWAGWPLASPSRTVLAFGATYRATDATTSSMHHGVDLAAPAGVRVIAPLTGDVTFAGEVPGVGGGTVRAVSVSTDCGTLTLLPLESISVKRGSHVSAGDDVGTLAAAGDGSSAETHLHVGLKRGELYVDPLGVLVPPAASAGGSATSPVVHPHAAPAAATRTSARAGAGVTSGARVSVGSGIGAFTAQASPAAGRVAVPGAVLAPGVSIAGGRVSQPAAATPVRANAAASAPTPTARVDRAPSLAPLADVAIGVALRSVEGAGWALLAILVALGALWPAWRSAAAQGSCKVRVRPGVDDVAAVSGR